MADSDARGEKPSLLAPIALNAPPPSKKNKKRNSGIKLPNPLPQGDGTPLGINNAIRRQTILLDDMEPPPPIPAALEEPRLRSRPSSTSSLRWEDALSADEGNARRTSIATDSTGGAWAERSPGAGSTGSPRGKHRRPAFFRNHSANGSTASLDGGDEMDYNGAATPASRRSVNFARDNRASADFTSGDDTETPVNPKRPGFFKRLTKFGNSSHGRSQSGWTVDSLEDPHARPFTPGTPYSPHENLDEGAESEGMHLPRSRSFSPAPGGFGTRSVPTTPKLPSRPRRRATVTDISEERERDDGTPSSRKGFGRRGSLRRIRRGDDDDRGYIPGSARETASKNWRAIKAGIKMIGTRKKEESKMDREKSAELVAELSAGTPAVAILASMFQRDEHGNKRIPVLLEQLKVKITDSKSHGRSTRGHTVFRIELEYGSGLTRMKWVIHREFRDFFNLHSRYRIATISENRFGGREIHRLPKFPRQTIPYLRGVRGLTSDDEEADGEGSGTEVPHVNPGMESDTPVPHQRRRPFLRRKSSTATDLNQDVSTGIAAGLGAATAAVGGASIAQAMRRNEKFPTKQRQQLEDYTRKLIRIMIFRPDSNRLCKFLELSALGVRLAAEGSYHGKEGYLVIRSSKGSDFRRTFNPAEVAKRHSPKWFLVRHSYIVCVDSPDEMNIYDVFLVDADFAMDIKKSLRKNPKELAVNASANPAHPQHHSLKISNGERSLKLLAKNERQLHQFNESIRFMQSNTIWSQPKRFGSFAPVRKGVFAQWLVDGRDYFWNVSRAISMAKDVIYIHDWWLSPELYLRRPAAVSQKWRLDRLLQRKAREGVKIFVIVYRNIGAAIPIDSSYTKYSLLDLSPNVFVQRSPNQIRQQAFFWAHHEKILIVDHMIAFVGGLDLCFGRWDTPQHALTDSRPSGFEEASLRGDDPDGYQLWPGKDYSNPRVQDFFNLDRPYEDMYDRDRVPRMPWHDIHMQIVGQPARDLTRHFVQRWNYLLRQRTPSRPTPLLLPPPDFTDGELESLGIDGTCEVQILRSACPWSLGTPNKTEHSIQNAYLKSIEMSDHLVYIENQFFITSTTWEGVVIENKIGDALVERIIRAHNRDEDWRAIIIIPLMPGFQNTVDAQDGTSVRLIMRCQYRSISRGEASIFGRLRAVGIDPDDYIQFFSLRNWGKIGQNQTLVTEQLYIHAKCMIVDDRITIIGSANINERSMNGNRDSEVAAIVRDTDTLMIKMGGQPYRVGRFPHTLRVRLMREHLGLDVDHIMTEERMEEERKMDEEFGEHVHNWHNQSAESSPTPAPPAAPAAPAPAVQPFSPEGIASKRQTIEEETIIRMEELRSFNHDVDWEQENNPNLKARKKETADPRVMGNEKHRQDVRGFGADHMVQRESERVSLRRSRPQSAEPKSGEPKSAEPKAVANLKSQAASPGRSSYDSMASSRLSVADDNSAPPLPPLPAGRVHSSDFDLPLLSQLPPLPAVNDADIGGQVPPSQQPGFSTGTASPAPSYEYPKITPEMFDDPLDDAFYTDVWLKCAQNNTEIYRQVFRCMPDNEVKTWAQYKDYGAYQDRFGQMQEHDGDKARARRATEDSTRKPGPPGPMDPNASNEKLPGSGEKVGGITINLPPEDRHGEGNDPEKTDYPRDSFISNGTRPRSHSHASSRLNTATSFVTNNSTNSSSAQPPGSRGSVDNQGTVKSKVGSVSYNTDSARMNGTSTRRKRRNTAASRKREFLADGGVMQKEPAERMLNMIQGHLVLFPYDWLVREEEAGNWLYNIDSLAPIEIYN